MQSTGETVDRKDEEEVHSFVNCITDRSGCVEPSRTKAWHTNPTTGGACNECIFVALGFFPACTHTTLITKYLAPVVCNRGRQATQTRATRGCCASRAAGSN